ncbi:hypothetical protein QZH41_001063 [Actinostola sp. cb2023]|nr:hypothetical protein QZH41_001063 [Actinostola sp. cb2023]
MGGHVIFSHYKYFDEVLDNVVSQWNEHKTAAFAFMKGSSGKRSFIPYPVQENVLSMDKQEQQNVMKDLQKLIAHPVKERPNNFDQWLLKNFGKELSDIFMRKYNKKVWTVDPKEMNSLWVGERVAVPSIEKIKANRESKDSDWGPNRCFRFPKFHGTGGIWQSVADLLPSGWFHFKHRVDGIDIQHKTLSVTVDGNHQNTYTIHYDNLITTAPLDILINMDKKVSKFKYLAKKLVYSHTHVIGIGLKGQAPKHLSDKSWIYFPDSDSPFYRVTVFSKYSADDVVPDPANYWSLMCEAAEPKHTSSPEYWKKDNVIRQTVSALIIYGFITKDQVVSEYHRRLDHGYPVPSIDREIIIGEIQPWLQANSIYSRGRFGGWRVRHNITAPWDWQSISFKNIETDSMQIPSTIRNL